jgi:site-specific recombinase XerD
VQRVVAQLGKVAGIEGLTPHVLRHTFAKNLVDAGVGLEKVADLLGHRRLETTRIYTRPGERDLERAVEAIVAG